MSDLFNATQDIPAISLWQPWASAIAVGLKRIETRGWSTAYRGPLVIHAAKRWTREERAFAGDARAFGYALPEYIPLGALVATCTLVDVRRSEALASQVSAAEDFFGNFGPRRFGWVLDSIVALPEPVPYRGAQGLFRVPSGLVQAGEAA